MSNHKIILSFFLVCYSFVFISCNAQTIDLETLDFDKDLPSFSFDQESPYITQGAIFPSGEGYSTFDISNIRFGNVTFSKPDFSRFMDDDEEYDEETLIMKLTSSAGSPNLSVILDDNDPTKIIGYCLSLSSLEEGERLSEYLEKKYGKETKFLSPENPKHNKLKNGVLIGISAYVWENTIEGKTLGFYKDYMYSKGKQTLFVTLYMVDKDKPVKYGISDKEYTFSSLLIDMWGWSGLTMMD